MFLPLVVFLLISRVSPLLALVPPVYRVCDPGTSDGTGHESEPGTGQKLLVFHGVRGLVQKSLAKTRGFLRGLPCIRQIASDAARCRCGSTRRSVLGLSLHPTEKLGIVDHLSVWVLYVSWGLFFRHGGGCLDGLSN